MKKIRRQRRKLWRSGVSAERRIPKFSICGFLPKAATISE
jgi:hypothetical protein